MMLVVLTWWQWRDGGGSDEVGVAMVMRGERATRDEVMRWLVVRLQRRVWCGGDDGGGHDGDVMVAAVGRQPEEVEARGGEWIWGSGRSGHGDKLVFGRRRRITFLAVRRGGKGGWIFGEDGGGREGYSSGLAIDALIVGSVCIAKSKVFRIDQGLGSTSGIRACALRNFDLEVMELENTQNNALAKLPMLKLGEYEMWEIRIKQYFHIQDYALWEVIENGNSWIPIPVTTPSETGTSTGTKMTMPSTIEEKTCKKNDVKARSLLLMALPNEHQLTFDQYVDAQPMFAAIKARFGGNEATKKTQKALLKQQYENFSASSSESLDSIFNRLQRLVSRLAILGLDDLYNNFKIVELEVRHLLSQSIDDKNLDFTASFNDARICFLIHSTKGSQLVHEDLEQLHDDDLEEMDLKWNMALLSMRARKFYQRTGRKIIIDGSNTVGAPRSKDNKNWNQSSSTKTVKIEDASEKVMCAIDGAGFDWSDMAEEEIQTNMALMAFSDSEVTNEKSCSKSCLKNYEALKKRDVDLLLNLDDTGFKAATYKRGLATLEDQIVKYREHEVRFSEEIALLKRSIAKFDKSAKDLNEMLESQISDKSKKGVGYHAVPSPHPLILNRPTPLDLSYSGLENFKEPEVNEYGPRDSNFKPTIGCDKESDNSKENTDDSLEQHQITNTKTSSINSSLKVSDDEDDDEPNPKVEKKMVVPTATQKEYVKPEKPVKRPVRFQVSPKTSHLLAVKRIFRYLKGKPSLGLWYSKDSPLELVAYTDSDYAGATQDRKSTTGGCQFLGNRLISWQCKKQTVVATSTTEAEYVAAASCCGQITATIDGHSMTITEASLRRHLKLDDHDGITSIPNSEIFEQLALMGYHTDSDNPKKTDREQFSSNIATAIICLATNRKYNFSRMIFEHMVSNISSSHKFLMYPRFIQICLDMQRKQLQQHSRTYHVPSLSIKVFNNMKRPTKGYSGQEVALFPTMLAVSEPSTSPSRITSSPSHSPEPSPSPQPSPSPEPSFEHSPNYTTAVVTQPSPTQPYPTQPSPTQLIPTPNESPLHAVHIYGSDEGSLKLNELTNLVIKLSDRIGILEDDLRKTKKTYSSAFNKLILRVKKLEARVKIGKARKRAKIVLSEDDEDIADDSSKQGRKLSNAEDGVLEADLEDKETYSSCLYQLILRVKKLGEEVIDEEVREKASTDTDIHSRMTQLKSFQDQEGSEKASDEVFSTHLLGKERYYCEEVRNSVVPAEGKAIMFEEEPKKKSKKELEQERLSYAKAIRLEEQMNKEQRAQIARDEEIAKHESGKQKSSQKSPEKSPTKEKSPEKVVEEEIDTQEELTEGVKEPGAKRKKSIPRKSTRKRQKLEEDAEKDELKGFFCIVTKEKKLL
ncbi:hypothetical protein Tco_1176289 [Tanacetum coccineum]